MLVDSSIVQYYLNKYNIKINGVLHVGAHLCEEKGFYNQDLKIDDSNIIWVEANPKLVEQNKNKGIMHCYNSVLDETERTTTFNIANNGQSSSILEFGTHSNAHPDIVYTENIQVKTQTLTQFYKLNNLSPNKYNFWNFDIQGSELHVFRGSKELLKTVDCIYTEVNTSEVYKGCGQINEIDSLLNDYGLVRVATKMFSDWGDALYIRTTNLQN